MGFDFKNASAAERKAECKRIAADVGDDLFFTKKELNHLPDILLDGERVISFTSGMMDGNTWLITLTDKRIIFLDKGMLYGLKQAVVDLDKVNAVSGETGLILGSISIQDGATNRTIKNVQKKTVVNFTNKVRDAIEARKKNSQAHTSTSQSAGDVDVIYQLERLASLKEKGILTQDEFDYQKSKLSLASTSSSGNSVTPEFNGSSAQQAKPAEISNSFKDISIEIRSVGIPLGIGIVLAPLIFSWFTLRNGYSTKARVIALGWLFLTTFCGIIGSSGTSTTNSTSQQTTAIASPIFDEDVIFSASDLKPVKKYELEDGHGFYIQKSPDAAIEFRDNPPRINVALRTFPEAGYEEKNATANEIAKKLVSVITGTDGKLVDDAVAGRIKLGKQFINGLPVNVSGIEHDWLITISKQ